MSTLAVLLGGCGGPGGNSPTDPSDPSPVTEVVVTPGAVTLDVGGTAQLSVVVEGEAGVSQAVSWKSGSTNVATVSASGLVSGVANGAATITATSAADPSKSGSAQLTVGSCAPLELKRLLDVAATLVDRVDDCPDYISEQFGFHVFAPLTIEPGVTILFRTGTRMEVGLGGSITAVGTSSQPIIFTGPVKEPGSWAGIDLDSELPSVLEHVVVEYGVGNIKFRSEADTSLTLKNSTVSHSLDYGLEVVDNAYQNDLIDFTNNTFSDNAIAIRLHVGNLTQLDGASTYAEPGSDSVIEVTGGPADSTRADGTWLATGAPYLITGDVDIRHAITVEDGATFLFEAGTAFSIVGPGSITAVGSSEGIVFGGTEKVPGHWKGIYVRSGESSTLDNVTVEHGGGVAVNGANIIMYSGTSLTLTDSTIRHSAGYGLFVIGSVNVVPDNKTDLLAQNTFEDNASGDIAGLD